MAHNPSPHLYQLHLKAAQRLVLDCLGQGQPAQEVPQVVGQNEKLEPNLVGIKPVAGEPGSVQGILALQQHLVGGKPDGIADVPWLQVFVYLRLGKGSISPEQHRPAAQHPR